MRLRDDRKRATITATAAKLFANQPFHKVRLDDVAAAAGVGKGTLYVYFQSKEDLFFSILYDGFAGLVDRLKQQLAHEAAPAMEKLAKIVRELVDFAAQHPQLFQLMRSVALPGEESDWEEKRKEFAALIEQTLRQGVEAGELCDDHPELTALYIPSFVRAAMLFGPKQTDPHLLTEHILGQLKNGICVRERRDH